MSLFDQAVCEYLNTSSIPSDKKQVLLNRASTGVSNYRALENDRNANATVVLLQQLSLIEPGTNPITGRTTARTVAPPTSAHPGRTVSVSSTSKTGNLNDTTYYDASRGRTLFDVDYSVQAQISKALRRLQEGDQGSEQHPLFNSRHLAASNAKYSTLVADGGPAELVPETSTAPAAAAPAAATTTTASQGGTPSRGGAGVAPAAVPGAKSKTPAPAAPGAAPLTQGAVEAASAAAEAAEGTEGAAPAAGAGGTPISFRPTAQQAPAAGEEEVEVPAETTEVVETVEGGVPTTTTTEVVETTDAPEAGGEEVEAAAEEEAPAS